MSNKRLKTHHQTSNTGRPSRWTDEQQKLIDAAIPEWHNFSIVKHGNLKGRSQVLADWKKKEANRLLEMEAFQVFPSGVSIFSHMYSSGTLCRQ
jgi:hypothetical protein